jgi:hypothetical protein
MYVIICFNTLQVICTSFFVFNTLQVIYTSFLVLNSLQVICTPFFVFTLSCKLTCTCFSRWVMNTSVVRVLNYYSIKQTIYTKFLLQYLQSEAKALMFALAILSKVCVLSAELGLY